MDPDDDGGGVDWRRLASDRNVSRDVARGLWEHAQANAHDPIEAERAFQHMLDAAASANATHEPGRETLVEAREVKDASSLGPGKHTRVLDENKQAKAAPLPKSAEALRNDLDAAVRAGKSAVDIISKSDPATIVEALRAIGASPETSAVLQKVMTVAGKAIERALDAKAKTGPNSDPVKPAAKPAPAPTKPKP